MKIFIVNTEVGAKAYLKKKELAGVWFEVNDF